MVAPALSALVVRSTRMYTRLTMIWTALACVIALLTLPIRGADSVPPENPPRFLIIVEKSEATEALRLDLPQTVFDLVYRGANGHLPDGAVFEIWLFGAETIFRGFQPQMLTTQNHLPLASRASGYVRAAKSGGKADVSKLVEHIRGAGEMGLELTVILVTAPDTRLNGTRSDREINGVLDANAETQRTAGRPFITSIRVQDGQLAAFVVSDSPFTMVIPPMPATQLSAEERDRRIAEARKVRLEKEQPVAATAAVAPAPATPPLRRNRDIPDEEREGAIIIKGSATRPPVVDPTASQPVATAAPTSSPAIPVEALAKPTAATESAATTPTPGSTTLAPASPPAEPPKSEAIAVAPLADPVAPATIGGTPAVTVTNPAPASATVAAPLTNGLPQTAVTLPSKTWLTAGGLFVAGLCFFVVAALLAWVLMRRARAVSGPSYITRSIEERRD